MQSQCVEIGRGAIGFTKVLLLVFLLAAVAFAVTLYFSRQIIVDDWELYKCEPMITMAAEMFGKSSADTVYECQNRTYKCASPKLVKPFMRVFDSMSLAFGDIDFLVGDLDKLNMGTTNVFTSQFKLLLGKMKIGGSAIDYIVAKIMAIFKRIISSMVVLLYGVYTMLQGLLATVHDKQLIDLLNAAIDFAN
jgi:hypothetical protein